MKDGVVTLVEQPVFVKRGKHELADLLKRVESGSAKAVDLLIETMEAPEEKVSLKNKLECAKFLIDLEVRIKAEINKDQLTRQIAEIKAKGLSTPLGEDKPPAPKTDFMTIQSV